MDESIELGKKKCLLELRKEKKILGVLHSILQEKINIEVYEMEFSY